MACDLTISEWDKASMLPTPAFIIERIDRIATNAELAREGSMADRYKHLRGRLDPEVWSAIEDHGRSQEYISGEARQDYAKRIIAEMRAKIARGDYDFPKPPVPGGESYRVAAERSAAQRNGPSTIPADPAKRRSWAHEKAKNMGWLVEREAGDEAE